MLLYQDKLLKAFLPISPVTNGHVKLSNPATGFEELSSEDTAHLLSTASFTSTALFEALNAHGTNIILTDLTSVQGEILARMEDDGLSLQWKPLELQPHEMDDIAARIKDKCDYIGHDRPAAHVAPQADQPKTAPEPKKDEWTDEKDYLLKQLERIP